MNFTVTSGYFIGLCGRSPSWIVFFMRKFIEFFLTQKVLVNLLFLLLMVVGAVALMELPVERYPNVNMGKMMITTFLPGASPTDVEALVTREIEQALDDLEEVEFIKSTSYRGRSSIMVKFVDDADYPELFKELRLKVLGSLPNLPQGVEPPEFQEVDVNYWLPVVTVNLVGDRSNRTLTLISSLSSNSTTRCSSWTSPISTFSMPISFKSIPSQPSENKSTTASTNG